KHCPNLDEKGSPADSRGIDCKSHWRRYVQSFIADQAGEHKRDKNVENGADDKRTEDANRHIALGVLGFLSSSGYGVESNICKENRCSRSRYAKQAEVALAVSRRNKRMPIRSSHIGMLIEEVAANDKEDPYNGDFD